MNDQGCCFSSDIGHSNMEDMESTFEVTVTWRGKKYVVETAPDALVKDLGYELQILTDVKADTMRLIVPQSSKKGSKLLSPFTAEHSRMSLHEASIIKGRNITMMGVSKDEVDKLLQSAKADLRIAGFDEEEKRMRQRLSAIPRYELKLPTGPYIFCDFRTLHLPGIELNPSPSEALKRMHTLAADPGIVGIMNKHRWRVGIMTEMAPVGYVGVSPKCVLGFNKNQGEEISLRLRTDDLKGFRKYDSIKKTLLHELAHMVFSEHDANFFALNKQLNEEAASLDWMKSKGHTLSAVGRMDRYHEDFPIEENVRYSQKLGGNASDELASARAASVLAAYRRLANSTAAEVHEEPDPDDPGVDPCDEPDPDENYLDQNNYVTIPDDIQASSEPIKPDPDDLEVKQGKVEDGSLGETTGFREPDPDDHVIPFEEVSNMRIDEPDPDEIEAKQSQIEKETIGTDITGYREPDPDDQLVKSGEMSDMQVDEPDPDDKELQVIQDPVTIVCGRLQKALRTLKSEVNPIEATASIQTLFKIISNVIEHPQEEKFRRLRKANPIIQKNIANYKAAVEILRTIGFNEDMIFDEIGRMDAYFVLKRNDPGLLWLARSCLEA